MIDFITSTNPLIKINYSGEERRSYPRAQYDLALQYRILNKNYSQATGVLAKDISAGGMKFVSSNFLPVFTLLRIELLLESDIHSISLTARVAWTEKLPYNENYLIGVEFLNIKNEDRVKINSFVNAKIVKHVSSNSDKLTRQPLINV